jgi:SAM-dependent methyltransferase
MCPSNDPPAPKRELFFSVYDGQPPWDIGRPQEVYLRLADSGHVRGSVLDVGCGPADNALLFAERGHEVWGIDMVPKAIELAKEKAARRGLSVTLRVADALALETLGRQFDVIIDSGLFHVFPDEQRALFVQSLGRALRPGGTYYMLCFSDEETAEGGPRRIRQDDIRTSFAKGWKVRSIERARFESHRPPGGAKAWFATIERAQS